MHSRNLKVTDLTGTDHPFFPPLDDREKWPSVTMNYSAIKNAFNEDDADMAAVLGGNAVRILNLT